MVELIDELWDAGAGGVLLGCTELELLIHQADVDLPVFPCTTLHVEAALDRALAEPTRDSPHVRLRQPWTANRHGLPRQHSSATRRRSSVRCCSGTVARSPQRSKA